MEHALKGYNIISALQYLDEHYTAEQAQSVRSQLSDDVVAALPSLQPFEFYPRRFFGELTKAMAELHADPEDRAQAMVKFGNSIARGATNTFLRLLMRMMTPKLLAKKIDQIWARDHRGGKIEADASRIDDNVMEVKLADIDGFTYFNAIGVGWFQFGFASMGCRDIGVKLLAGTAHDEITDTVHLEVRWT